MVDEKIVNKNISEIIELLRKVKPDVSVALTHSTPLELLIATILSAQCTDRQVNEVTKKLFKKYKSKHDYIAASQEELEKEIYSTGFYRNKAKNIKKMCEMLVNNFNGEVPDTMEELVTLPGVARKTANIVLSGAFGKLEGIAVDTHVKRLSFRLGLTDKIYQDKIEKDLMELVPRKDWDNFSLLLIHHGRNICNARKPACIKCVLNRLCPSAFSFG
ncbi:MAG: endonuclease III [Methanosarcinales archaeon]|nr:MAG: endonuclease III [Methanosarcinales archaeon]